ncbi:MAG TPA: tetratricopeptide repeat protein [Blastocatellia bacterium]|nr:tetratricopeptide repeat protein [Blastocatellia bacterium]
MTVSGNVFDFEFGPYKLSKKERLLTRNGQPVNLGKSEFNILVLLVENAGRLLYKEEIVEKAWPDSYAEISTMDVTVCRLRKKLRDGKQDYIQRVTGLGLRFIGEVRVIGEVRPDDEGKTPAIVTAAPLTPASIIAHSFNPSSFDHGDFAKGVQDAVMIMNLLRVCDMFSLFRDLILLILRTGVFHMLSPEQKASFFYNLALKSDGQLIGAEQSAWLDAFDCAHAQMRITLDYYHDDQACADRELEIAILLTPHLDVRGYWAEGAQILQRALARHGTGVSRLKTRGLARLGMFLCCQDDYTASKAALLESVKMSRLIGDKESLALASSWLGRVANVQGRYSEAKIFLSESLKVSEEIQSGWLSGMSIQELGDIAESEGDQAEAKDCYLRQLAQEQEIKNTRGIATALSRVGAILCSLGDHIEAQKYIEKSLPLRGGLRHKWGLGESYMQMGLTQEAAGRHSDADRFFKQALTMHREIDDKHWVARAMEGVGRVAVVRGDEKTAARTFGAADALRASIGAPLSKSERKNYGHLINSAQNTALTHFREGSRRADEIATAIMAEPA